MTVKLNVWQQMEETVYGEIVVPVNDLPHLLLEVFNPSSAEQTTHENTVTQDTIQVVIGALVRITFFKVGPNPTQWEKVGPNPTQWEKVGPNNTQ